MIVAILIEGKVFEGWSSVSISAGIDRIARSFTISSAIFDKQLFNPNSECRVLIDDEPIVTGFIDGYSTAIDAGSLVTTIQGRSKTGTLADACPTGKLQWRNKNAKEIIADLISPYNITLIADGYQDSNIISFATKEDGKIIDTINELIQARGDLLFDDANGNLILNSGQFVEANDYIELGLNIATANYSVGYSDVYGRYLVRGQFVSEADSNLGASFNEAVVLNNLITRPKDLILIQTGTGDLASCKKRAEFEKKRRNALLGNYSCSLPDWKDNTGNLWQIATSLEVIDSLLSLNEKMVIKTIDYNLTSSSMNIDLNLQPLEAYE